jgi:oligopeptide transport system ATP-binding protein
MLSIRNFSVTYPTPAGVVTPVININLDIGRNESLAIVGESGSGKSQLFLGTLGLSGRNARVTGEVLFDGKNLVAASEREMRQIRGRRIAYVFQNPLTSLNPYLKIGTQMAEVLARELGAQAGQIRERCVEALDMVQIPEGRRRLDMYPHEFSGGMRQRAMIAMALLCKPDLLIADEPTTALDVTVQAHVIDLLGRLRKDLGMSIVLITHNLGIVAGFADRTAVMYGGRVIELSETREMIATPRHPYTLGLLKAVPELDDDIMSPLATIPGQPPNSLQLPAGCTFHPRCSIAEARCLEQVPELAVVAENHGSRCIKWSEVRQ